MFSVDLAGDGRLGYRGYRALLNMAMGKGVSVHLDVLLITLSFAFVLMCVPCALQVQVLLMPSLHRTTSNVDMMSAFSFSCGTIWDGTMPSTIVTEWTPAIKRKNISASDVRLAVAIIAATYILSRSLVVDAGLSPSAW